MKPSLSDAELLRRFRLCRADMVAAVCHTDALPHRTTLKELAELQLVIMAVEGVIADKRDPKFSHEILSETPTASPPTTSQRSTLWPRDNAARLIPN